MYRRLLLILALALWGCEGENRTEWHPREYLGPVCEACPSVRVAIPEASETTALGRGVNQALREEVIELLDYDETRDATSIAEAIGAFGSGYEELRRQFPDEAIGWEADIEGQITFEDDQLLTLKLETYIFTGGAHGLSTIRYLNFDKKTGQELRTEELFADVPALENLAERAFREAKGIPAGAGINDTGFMFEEDRFSLPENMGFTAEGLELLYNPYEVASYADGPISVVVPMERITPLLSSRLQPRRGT
jgi:hypothetical protein